MGAPAVNCRGRSIHSVDPRQSLASTHRGGLQLGVARWWEWLGRILWTLMAMGAAGVVVLALGWLWYVPSVVSDWHSQVVERLHIVLGIGAAVSVSVGVVFWRHYPSLLRRRGFGWA